MATMIKQRRPAPAPSPEPIVKHTRRSLLALLAALAVVAALGAGWFATSSDNRVPVVKVARDVDRGQVLAVEDLQVVREGLGDGVASVEGARMEEMVGQYADVDLRSGQLLTETAVTSQQVPGAGEAVVGVAVREAQLPGVPLRPGDRVVVVSTPEQGAPDAAGSPATVEAVVVSAQRSSAQDLTMVDVTVPEDQAASLAAQVATGRVAIVLGPRGD